MEKESIENKTLKKYFAIIIILITIILSMAIYIISNSFFKKNEIKQVENNITTQEDKKVSSDVLEKLTNIIGITRTDLDSKSSTFEDTCLNYFLTDNNYSNNAHMIMSLYGLSHGYIINDGSNNEFWQGTADTYIISKVNMQKLSQLFGFTGNVYDYVWKEYDENNYAFGSIIQFHGGCAAGATGIDNLNINHDLNSSYLDNGDIEIIDNQNITGTLPETNENILINKEAHYIFRLNNDEYNLLTVEVK